MGPIGNLILSEGGHPVPDENSYKGTQLAIDAVKDLGEEDLVLFLISGGGSALFEKPLVSEGEMADITRQLLACGADIVEMNTLRKRLSAVKGGKFAQLCAPAKVFSIILSDVLGDPLDMIASGPAYPDSATREQALAIIEKYQLRLSDEAMALMEQETPKTLSNVESHVTGSVKQLCAAAAATAESLGYKPVVLTASLSCEARDAGSFLAAIAQYHAANGEKLAFIAGGETVVHLTGKGKGGRNQELALAGAKGIAGLENALLFSLGSDGTDGPTDAAGGIVDSTTAEKLLEKGIRIDAVLQNNDAYHALKAVDGLIITGPIRRKRKMKQISQAALDIICRMQQNEMTESEIYQRIATFAKGEENRQTLLRLAREERAHYEIWKRYSGKEMKPQMGKVFKYTLLARVFGFTFAVKLMEQGEGNAQEEYALLAQEVEESIQIREQEEEHEQALLAMLDEERLQYVGSMVLGLNDALVELTGSLAGFAFALQNTRLIALSGLIVGISATFSMASSEFLAARSEGRSDALKSCSYTGIAYLITVVALIAPYLLFPESQFIPALICMLAVVVLIIAGFTYYTSVAQDQPFKSRFLEMALISITVAVLSFLVGVLAKKFLGVDV